ncbi:MAG: GntR family transcriptional regulator, partial [Singulisphaera sp.]
MVLGSGGAIPDPAPARGLLKERAYDEIKRLILTGNLIPGTFLAERQLTARLGRLGMGMSPVRSALERLESEGFASARASQSFVVPLRVGWELRPDRWKTRPIPPAVNAVAT